MLTKQNSIIYHMITGAISVSKWIFVIPRFSLTAYKTYVLSSPDIAIGHASLA